MVDRKKFLGIVVCMALLIAVPVFALTLAPQSRDCDCTFSPNPAAYHAVLIYSKTCPHCVEQLQEIAGLPGIYKIEVSTPGCDVALNDWRMLTKYSALGSVVPTWICIGNPSVGYSGLLSRENVIDFINNCGAM